MINENKTISIYSLWQKVVLAEDPDQYIRPYQSRNVEDQSNNKGKTETPIHPIPVQARQSDGSPKLRLQIDSNPKKAEIWVDGESKRTVTPNEVILKRKGFHDIELFKSGYLSIKDKIYISSPKSILLNLTPIHQAQAEPKISNIYIAINSIPEGASIWIDDNLTEKFTPDKIYFDTFGNHTYGLFLSGYEPFEGNVSVTGAANMSVTLKPHVETTKLGFPVWYTLLAVILIYLFAFRAKPD
jgi:hypothetical protein